MYEKERIWRPSDPFVIKFNIPSFCGFIFSLLPDWNCFENPKICAAAVILKNQVSKTLMLPPPAVASDNKHEN